MRKLLIALFCFPIMLTAIEQDITFFDIPPSQRSEDFITAFNALRTNSPTSNIRVQLIDGSFFTISFKIVNPLQPMQNGTMIIFQLTNTVPAVLRVVFVEDIVGLSYPP